MGKISKTLLVGLLVITAFACNSYSLVDNNYTRFEVQLNHPFASEVNLILQQYGIVTEHAMTRIDNFTYQVDIALQDSTNYLCNIKVVSDLYPDRADWIARSTGVNAVFTSINGTLLTNEYLVRTGEPISTDQVPSAAFSFFEANNTVSAGIGEKWNPNPMLPPEIPQYHEYCRLRLPPSSFSAGLPWMQALHSGNANDSSKVEIDYLRFYAHTPDGDTLLCEDDYLDDLQLAGYDNGGTYLRYPFFFLEEENNWAMPAEIANGNLVFFPGAQRDRVFHWWTSERATIPQDAEYVYAEARVRITGDACVQLAVDFWRDLESPYSGFDVNNTEAGVSDFIFGMRSDEWQPIYFSTENLIPWID